MLELRKIQLLCLLEIFRDNKKIAKPKFFLSISSTNSEAIQLMESLPSQTPPATKRNVLSKMALLQRTFIEKKRTQNYLN